MPPMILRTDSEIRSIGSSSMKETVGQRVYLGSWLLQRAEIPPSTRAALVEKNPTYIDTATRVLVE